MQERKKTILAELKSKMISKKELDNGFDYQFISDDAMLDLLIEFIKTERKCCVFFDFGLQIEGGESGFAWLSITGPAGAKDFVRSELEL